MESGYYRFPTIHQETIVFACEDDLWSVSAAGGLARRLTSNLGRISRPAFSPDGTLIAFTGRDEGPTEVYCMPALGGPAKRLTYLGTDTEVVGWTPDGQSIIFSSNVGQPFGRLIYLYVISPQGGEPKQLPTGPAMSISYGSQGGLVIGRNTTDLASWKRYRGGLTGDMWVDPDGQGNWQRLIDLDGNLAMPLWIGERIYFVSDHEGIGNLYSCKPPLPHPSPLPGGEGISPHPQPLSYIGEGSQELPLPLGEGRGEGQSLPPESGGTEGGSPHPQPLSYIGEGSQELPLPLGEGRGEGQDLRRHTHHAEYYVRHPSTDGRRIVYHMGADLYLFDPATDQTQLITIEFHSPKMQCQRRFVEAEEYLESYDIHPQGHSVAIVTRGKPFTMANWEQAVMQHGELSGVRYRLATWMFDGERLVMVSDAAGEEMLEIHPVSGIGEMQRLEGLEMGRPISLITSPINNQVVLTNHRNELIWLDFDQDPPLAEILDYCRYHPIQDVTWSFDGRWLAYSYYNTPQTSIIKLCDLETGNTHAATRPVLRDISPSFDPDGKYLYFLSYRDFDPVYDNMHFDLNFPWGMRPYLITLQADLPSPFIPKPAPPDDKDDDDDDDDKPRKRNKNKDEAEEDDDDDDEAEEGDDKNEAAPSGEKGKKKRKIKPLRIDLEGITERVVAFPVLDGLYGQIRGLSGKVIYSTYPVEGALEKNWSNPMMPLGRGDLEEFDFDDQEGDVLIEGISDFELSQDGKTLIYRAGNRLRVIKAGSKPDNFGYPPNRKTGWLDLSRIRLSIQPQSEWEQMYRGAWRLQRDYFWNESMSGVDWQQVYQRYFPLLARVATRSEFSDLMWEMQGELGTSHALEFGGDYRPTPVYEQGFLGVDFRYDTETDSYEVTHIVAGDVWDEEASSPLSRPGVRIVTGDQLVAINGRAVDVNTSPQELLVNQANNEVFLTFLRLVENKPYTVSVKTLVDEEPARYREWVDKTRQEVHEATNGRVGYVHIPDMGPMGYAEFHRGYLAEVNYEGLIVDVRFNGGGNVSQLVLEKLARRRLGYDVQRWGDPTPYPDDSLIGPIVALCNEQTGSDGDVFSHAFKLMKLGPLIGKRTWGGVIGIRVNEGLIDGGITTQPEFSFWFKDVGWGVENYGASPDMEVDIRPQDYLAGRDPQLERAIAEIMQLLAENPPQLPTFGNRPNLPLPKLPL